MSRIYIGGGVGKQAQGGAGAEGSIVDRRLQLATPRRRRGSGNVKGPGATPCEHPGKTAGGYKEESRRFYLLRVPQILT
jgi:hypothetical protein